MRCQFCTSTEAERFALIPQFIKGIRLSGVVVHTCPDHTMTGLDRMRELLAEQISDLPRRREILKLNNELKELIESGATPDKIAENRAEKTAMVLMQRADAQALLRAASTMRPAAR